MLRPLGVQGNRDPHMTYRVLAAAMSAAILTTPAFAAKISFEGLGPNGTEITAALVDGVSDIAVDSGGAVNALITFNTDLTGTADPDLEGPFDDPTTSRVEANDKLDFIAIIPTNLDFSNPNDEAEGGKVTITFDKVTTLRSMDFLDTSGGTVKLFNGMTELASFVIPDLDTDNGVFPNQFTTLIFGMITGVTSMEIDMNSSGGFDNITFNQVPVPAALPLFAAGFGGLVAARRKKRA